MRSRENGHITDGGISAVDRNDGRDVAEAGPCRAQIAPELLPKQLLDVWLVVHHENKKFHA
jgi:hypothetical protein